MIKNLLILLLFISISARATAPFISSPPAIDALTEFEAFSSPAVESTTSDGYLVKSGYPYTTVTKTAGSYIIDYTLQVAQSINNKELAYRVQWRLGTSGTWIDLIEATVSPPKAGNYHLLSSFAEISVPTDGVFQVQIQWGGTIDGGTASIRFATIKVGKVADI